MTSAVRRIPGAYGVVMVIVECREGAWSAVAEGIDMARRHGGSIIFALAVPLFAEIIVDMPGIPVISNDAAALEASRYGAQLLEDACSEARRQGVPSRTVNVDAMQRATGVLECAIREGADVIVVACEPVSAVVRLFNGSLVPGLVTAAEVPVVICRDKAQGALPMRRRRWRNQKHSGGDIAC